VRIPCRETLTEQLAKFFQLAVLGRERGHQIGSCILCQTERRPQPGEHSGNLRDAAIFAIHAESLKRNVFLMGTISTAPRHSRTYNAPRNSLDIPPTVQK
jgi:hypothetical protein